jgi:hypothetical protein
VAKAGHLPGTSTVTPLVVRAEREEKDPRVTLVAGRLKITGAAGRIQVTGTLLQRAEKLPRQAVMTGLPGQAVMTGADGFQIQAQAGTHGRNPQRSRVRASRPRL